MRGTILSIEANAQALGAAFNAAEITLSRGASMYKSGSYVISLREMYILNRQHEYLKQQMKCNWRKEMTLPCHRPLKVTASMMPKFFIKLINDS